MNEITNQPKTASRHTLPWNETFLWHLPALHLPQTEKIIHSNPSKTINNKYDHGVEKQTYTTAHWCYPAIVVYKRLVYLGAMCEALLLKFNPPRRTILWCLAAS